MNWRMGSKRTTVSSRHHGHISWKNQGKAHRIRRNQVPYTPIYAIRRVYAKRKRRRMPPSRHKGSRMLYVPQKGAFQLQLLTAHLESTQEPRMGSHH